MHILKGASYYRIVITCFISFPAAGIPAAAAAAYAAFAAGRGFSAAAAGYPGFGIAPATATGLAGYHAPAGKDVSY